MIKKLSIVFFSISFFFSFCVSVFADTSFTDLSQYETSCIFIANSPVSENLQIALYNANSGALIDGGTVSTNTNIPVSWYSSADSNYIWVLFDDEASPAWYSYSTFASVSSSSSYLGYMSFSKAGNSCTNYGWNSSSSPIIGCMDDTANNYNPDATEDSDPTSCTYDTPDPDSSLSLDLVDQFLGFLVFAGFNGLLFGVLLILFKRDSII